MVSVTQQTTTTLPHGRPRYQTATLPRIAALYCRVSSQRQAEDDRTSLQTQLAALRAKAAELGYATADDYTFMEALNGEELIERPMLSRLREDARARKFAIVLAYNVYALAKNQAHLAILHDEWERSGVALDFVTEQLEDTPIGRVILALRAFAAEVEGERRKDRITRARVARVQSGKPAVGHRPNYGYRWADVRLADGRLSRERLEVDPVTAPIVVRMYELVDAGHTLRGIAALFTREGIPTPTGRWAGWDPTSIRMLLLNPLYCGRPIALRRKSIPVDKSVRHLYARRSRAVVRPAEEQVTLPATYAPRLSRPSSSHVSASGCGSIKSWRRATTVSRSPRSCVASCAAPTAATGWWWSTAAPTACFIAARRPPSSGDPRAARAAGRSS